MHAIILEGNSPLVLTAYGVLLVTVGNVLSSNEPSLSSDSKVSAMIKKAHIVEMKTKVKEVVERHYLLQNEVNTLEKNLKAINDKLEDAGTNKTLSRTGCRSLKSSRLLNNEEIEDLIQECILMKAEFKKKTTLLKNAEGPFENEKKEMSIFESEFK